MSTRDNCGRRRYEGERVGVKGRQIDRDGFMQQRSRLVYPAFGFFRVSINTSYALSDPRRHDACHACISANVLNAVSDFRHHFIRGRLFQIRFILHRIFCVGIARITRTNVWNSVNGICSLGFRAFRRFAARIRTDYQNDRHTFFLHRSELRAFNVFQFCKAVSGEIKRQDFTRDVRDLLGFVVQSIVRRAGHAAAEDNVVGCFNRR